MFKKTVLTAIAIGASLLLATPVLAFELRSTTDNNANATSEKTASTPKQTDNPNKAEHKWRQHKEKKDIERRDKERKERERRVMRRKEQEKQNNQAPMHQEPTTTTNNPNVTKP